MFHADHDVIFIVAVSLYRTTDTGGHFTHPLASFPSLVNISMNNDASLLGGYFHNTSGQLAGRLYDIDTCQEVATFDHYGSGFRAYEHPNISFGCGFYGDHVVACNGSLWDLRVSTLVHEFDRISITGHSSFHPDGNSIIVDNAVWDLRTFQLACTAPVVEGAIRFL